MLALGIALLAALPYLAAGVSPHFVALDDREYVTANPQVLEGLSIAGARWALTAFHAANWHPLAWLSHMFDVTVFGLDARGHHATSVLLHALNAGLLFLTLRRMTGAVFRSAFVAALFGVHPLHVESVAWVAERKDVLAGLFFMLVLLAWERYARRGGSGRYLTALGLYAAGLAAKPMLVTLPFVLLLLDVWPLGRAPLPRGDRHSPTGWTAILVEKAPFLALAAASSAVTVLAQRTGGALEDTTSLSLGVRFANAIVSYASYLLTTIWPARLAVYYPYPLLPIPWPTIAAAVLFLASLSLAALRRPTVRPASAIGWCWFAGMLVPVIGLVQAGAQARADRYTYLPLIGIFVGTVWFAAEHLPSSLRRPRVLGPLAVGTVAVCVVASTVQAGYWRDSETLFRRTLAVTKDNWLIQHDLAAVLAKSGRHEEAIPLYREAVRIKPDYAEARYNLGNSLAALMRHEEAITQYREAIRIAPNLAEAHNNIGNSLATLGRLDEAAVGFREATRLAPDFAEGHFNLGSCLAALGRHEEALAPFREAVRIKADFAEAHYRLGISLAALGLVKEAAASYREAIQFAPDHTAARARLSRLAERGRLR